MILFTVGGVTDIVVFQQENAFNLSMDMRVRWMESVLFHNPLQSHLILPLIAADMFVSRAAITQVCL